ncbi:polyketide synthase dehydratase [Hirsutella rhossiliensis]|uniref:Polyketide synthase dehydratase domain-containing protein n=1 Tax=Hirsutella rhossiliensis TaxID=111463 RepID=A0A9P8MV38_9HYPO|nr:polyketide synthase dehydratase domain-containing protein [Hirsutella rhossiliensis]KAH0961785.1 polyketide synthase dehydratase domain-containing protein [Hirsutella rhossiliensis]
MSAAKVTSRYWVDNMCNSVMFAGALARVAQEAGDVNLVVKIGPHPALKGPTTAVIASVPYTGLLARGENNVLQLSAALGFVWTRLGTDSVRFRDVESLLSGTESRAKVLDDLPPYSFEHQRTYWTGSRMANHFKHRRAIHAPNPILGSPCSEATTPGEVQWRNILRLDEMSWLKGHMLPLVETKPYSMVSVDNEAFYANLSDVGYNYSPPFCGVSNIRRKPGYSVGTLLNQSGSAWEDKLALHPGMLGSALQATFAAWSFPGETQIWALHVPVSISTIIANPYFTTLGQGDKQIMMRYEAFIRSMESSSVVADIYLHNENASHADRGL